MRFPDVPGLTAKIYVNGVSLEEYDDDGEERATHSIATKYVEATSGANFAIKICFYNNFPYIGDNILCRVRVDGTAVIAPIYQPKNCAAYLIKGRYRNTANVSTLQRFAFADLQTHDGPANPSLKHKLKHLGTITLKFFRVEVLGRLSASSSSTIDIFPADGGLPEKSLKGRAISTHVTLSRPELSRTVTYFDFNYLFGREPFTTGSFKYRSRRDLQIDGILPRSPSPLPLEDRDPEDLALEEARELVRRMRAREVQIKQEVKREEQDREPTAINDDEINDDEDGEADEDGGNDDDGDDGDGAVSIEVRQPRCKRQRHSNDSAVELIDLTDD